MLQYLNMLSEYLRAKRSNKVISLIAYLNEWSYDVRSQNEVLILFELIVYLFCLLFA